MLHSNKLLLTPNIYHCTKIQKYTVHVYMYTHMYLCAYNVYIYIYRERERGNIES